MYRKGNGICILSEHTKFTKYKIGYETERIGHVKRDNIIWATDTLDKEEAQGDIERVLQEEKCYILASHALKRNGLNRCFSAAAAQGSLEIVQNLYETPLYFYAASPGDRKGRAV